MARKKSKRKKKHDDMGLAGADVTTNPYVVSLKDGVLMLITAVAAGGAGAAIGKHSLIVGLPVTVLGIHKKNKYIIAAGMGLTLSNGFQTKLKVPSTPVEGMGAIDLKVFAQEAKDRVSTFFRNFSQKLYVPETTTGGETLQGEEVTYFVNPYSTKELDLSEIDRIQEQIARANQQGTSGLNEIEREY